MLVLTRKKGERVMIGDDIVVTVIDVRGDGVRIGFDAPRGVSIQRAEVINAVREANAGAAASAAQSPDLLLGLLTKARKHEVPAAATDEAAPVQEEAAVAPRAVRRTLPAGTSKPTPPKPRS